MGQSKPILLEDSCPNCAPQGFESRLYLITFKGNHGEHYELEIHCNVCGYAIGAEGEVRDEGVEFPSLRERED